VTSFSYNIAQGKNMPDGSNLATSKTSYLGLWKWMRASSRAVIERRLSRFEKASRYFSGALKPARQNRALARAFEAAGDLSGMCQSAGVMPMHWWAVAIGIAETIVSSRAA
jgi:hypothetical protein